MKDIKDFKIKSMVINMKRALIPLSQSKVFKKFDITTTSHMPEFIQCIFVCYWVKVRVHIVYGLHHRNFYWISDKVKIGSLSTWVSLQFKIHFFLKICRHSKQIKRGKNREKQNFFIKNQSVYKNFKLRWFDASSY